MLAHVAILILTHLSYFIAHDTTTTPTNTACPLFIADPPIRLIQPRNATLYQTGDHVTSVVLVNTSEVSVPIHMTLYRHTSCDSCGFGIPPPITQIATYTHDTINTWNTYTWESLEEGVYSLFVSMHKKEQPDLSFYRNCSSSRVIATFHVISNETLWQPKDNQQDIQIYQWRLLQYWQRLNNATHLDQLDMMIDPNTNYRSLVATCALPPNTVVVGLPVHTIMEPVSILYDTPFLRDFTSLQSFLDRDPYSLNDDEHYTIMVCFIMWCVSVGEQCSWIHYILSFPHISFYMSSISAYRSTGSLSILAPDEYRSHAPPIPLTWTDDEMNAWNHFSGIEQIRKTRDGQIRNKDNIIQYLNSSIITHLNLPRHSDTSTTLHPFTHALLTWALAMRISRAWSQSFYLTRDHHIMRRNDKIRLKGAHMYPIMDLFDHDDERGRSVGTDVENHLVTLSTPVANQLASGLAKGDIIYDHYREQMQPISALTVYGYVLPRESHGLGIQLNLIHGEKNDTVTASDQTRHAAVDMVLKLLNRPLREPFSFKLSTLTIPPRLMLRARLLFYGFERDNENPMSVEKLATLLKQKQNMIFSRSNEALAHEYLINSVLSYVKLREYSKHKDTIDVVIPVEKPGEATMEITGRGEEKGEIKPVDSEEKLESRDITASTPSSSHSSSPLLPDSYYESLLSNPHHTYQQYALATFTLAERQIARHVISLIKQHQTMTENMEFVPLVRPSNVTTSTYIVPKSRRSHQYRLRSHG